MQIRIAPSLGELERDPKEAWGCTEYVSQEEPAVFMGIYGFNDFFTLWKHKGKKYIFWCGSDIRHLLYGYWLDDGGLGARIAFPPLADWINRNCESWAENDVEKKLLNGMGIKAQVCPSFLGDVNEYQISFKPNDRPKLYTSVSGDDFKLYGWDMIPKLAIDNPDIEFHLYGSDIYESFLPNVVSHGRVPKEQMNNEIKNMQGGLRLTKFDGFSEIIAKSVLWGQWPVSLIEYPHCIPLENIVTIKDKKEPNIEGRHYYLNTLNKFPWNQK